MLLTRFLFNWLLTHF